MSRKRSYHSQKAEQIQDKMARNLDELAELKDFKENVLPSLRRAVRDGKSAKEIYKMHEAALAARTVTIALTDEDPAKALTAIKEALDRGDGKATEHKNITVTSNMSEEELDALIESKQKELDSASHSEKH